VTVAICTATHIATHTTTHITTHTATHTATYTAPHSATSGFFLARVLSSEVGGRAAALFFDYHIPVSPTATCSLNAARSFRLGTTAIWLSKRINPRHDIGWNYLDEYNQSGDVGISICF